MGRSEQCLSGPMWVFSPFQQCSQSLLKKLVAFQVDIAPPACTAAVSNHQSSDPLRSLLLLFRSLPLQLSFLRSALLCLQLYRSMPLHPAQQQRQGQARSPLLHQMPPPTKNWLTLPLPCEMAQHMGQTMSPEFQRASSWGSSSR